MASSTPRRQNTYDSSSSRGSKQRRSNDSHDSRSTAPTSLYASPRPSEDAVKPGDSSLSRNSGPRFQQRSQEHYDEDLSPVTSQYPRSSTDTYASTVASEEDLGNELNGDELDAHENAPYEYDTIPRLPPYDRQAAEPNVKAATPQDFARLFPSLDRLSIRHDEFTSDGNMNLRVDTVVTGARRRTAVQLFHLRMHDLASRRFSLRRYCRDSGREVCNAKRHFAEPPKPKEKPAPSASSERPKLQRSMTTAFKTLSGGGPHPGGFRRTNSGGSMFSSRNRDSRPTTASSNSTSSSDSSAEEYGIDDALSAMSIDSQPPSRRSSRPRPLPTNTIKLEFGNYARVDVTRRGKASNKRYEFAWWGHKYQWRRASASSSNGGGGKELQAPSFHLVRDGDASSPVAHIVPETRSPSQVAADEAAGGWVPPCFMWIADPSVLEAMTDVADVIMATGLIALVDDCIKERWQTRKIHRIPVPLTSKTVDLEYVGPRAFMQHVFRRRTSQPTSPLRHADPISAF